MSDKDTEEELRKLEAICRRYHCEKCGDNLISEFRVIGYSRRLGLKILGGSLKCPRARWYILGHGNLWVEGESACQYRVWKNNELVGTDRDFRR